MRWNLLVLAACLVLGAGCYTTTYYNFEPPAAVQPTAHPPMDHTEPLYWRHFFLFGWIPGEVRIDAARSCGGLEHVAKLETEQSFLQGLLETLTSYYVNVYSPYTARVVCDHSKTE